MHFLRLTNSSRTVQAWPAMSLFGCARRRSPTCSASLVSKIRFFPLILFIWPIKRPVPPFCQGLAMSSGCCDARKPFVGVRPKEYFSIPLAAVNASLCDAAGASSTVRYASTTEATYSADFIRPSILSDFTPDLTRSGIISIADRSLVEK